jgi:hypothetical protein
LYWLPEFACLRPYICFAEKKKKQSKAKWTGINLCWLAACWLAYASSQPASSGVLFTCYADYALLALNPARSALFLHSAINNSG